MQPEQASDSSCDSSCDSTCQFDWGTCTALIPTYWHECHLPSTSTLHTHVCVDCGEQYDPTLDQYPAELIHEVLLQWLDTRKKMSDHVQREGMMVRRNDQGIILLSCSIVLDDTFDALLRDTSVPNLDGKE